MVSIHMLFINFDICLHIYPKHNSEMFRRNFKSAETFHFGGQTETESETKLITLVYDHMNGQFGLGIFGLELGFCSLENY